MVENILLAREGADALLFRRGESLREFVVAHNFNEETGRWSHGSYHSDLTAAVAELGHARRLTSIDVPDEYLVALVTPEIVESETGLRGEDAAAVAASACMNLSASDGLVELVSDQIDAEARTFMETAARERDVLFDRDRDLALADDEGYRAELEAHLDAAPGSIGYDLAARWAYSEMQEDLAETVAQVSELFSGAVSAERPEWRGSYELMARGSIERWDSTAQGHSYYSADPRSGRGPFEALIDDDGEFGLFKDCEIDMIWAAPDGTINVRGVHHDGAVEVSVRAVAPGTEEREGELLEWNGFPKDEVAYAAFIEQAWDDAVRTPAAGDGRDAIGTAATALDDLEAACTAPGPGADSPGAHTERGR